MDKATTQDVVLGIAGGSSHSLALVRTPSNGTIVVSWGRGEDGQLGHGDAEERTKPQAIFSLMGRGIRHVTCGAEYSVCLGSSTSDSEEVYAWGWADFGRLGLGDCSDVFIPTPIPAFSGKRVWAVACGDTHTLVCLEGSGELYSFGRNQNGQLGLGDTEDSVAPRLVKTLQGKKVIGIAAGAEHSLLCTSDGEVYSFGWGRYGNLGLGDRDDRHVPTKVDGLSNVISVAAGWRHSLAIADNKSLLLFSWGWSKYGQLGHGDQEDLLIPKCVESLKLKSVVEISGGWRHSAAILREENDQCEPVSTCVCWGWNKFGQLGLGHNEDVCTPTPVVHLEGEPIKHVAAGWKHTLVTTGTRTYAFGRGVNAQLGFGEARDVNVPVLVPELCADSMSIASLMSSAHPVVAYSIPPGDRYAVVPDNGVEGAPHAVPDAEGLVSDPKRQRV